MNKLKEAIEHLVGVQYHYKPEWTIYNDITIALSLLRSHQEEYEKLKGELECERLRLAACGTAALGYFQGCADEYKSASLDDVLRLRKENERLREALKMFEECSSWGEHKHTCFEKGQLSKQALASEREGE